MMCDHRRRSHPELLWNLGQKNRNKPTNKQGNHTRTQTHPHSPTCTTHTHTRTCTHARTTHKHKTLFQDADTHAHCHVLRNLTPVAALSLRALISVPFCSLFIRQPARRQKRSFSDTRHSSWPSRLCCAWSCRSAFGAGPTLRGVGVSPAICLDFRHYSPSP